MSRKQHVLDVLANYAAGQDKQRGRDWRPLVDTTNDPIIQNRRPEPWGSYQRNENYYVEGLLIWLEADAIIRRGTGNKRGMDDFARAFFGVRDGDWGMLPYTREEVIAHAQQRLSLRLGGLPARARRRSRAARAARRVHAVGL